MTQKSPSISVVIPAYNRNSQVQAAIASALAQQQAPSDKPPCDFDLEIIVVDDGSDTPISDHASSLVKIIRHPTNLGPGAARNTGVQTAQGSYVAFLDSDDTWVGNMLGAQMIQLNNARADTFGVFCSFKKATHPTRLIKPRKTKDTWFDTFLGGCRVAPGSTLMFRRELWDTVGPQNETLTRFEDWDWLLRASQSHGFEVTTDGTAVLGASKTPAYQTVASSLSEFEKTWRPRLTDIQLKRFTAATAIERAAHAKNNNLWGAFIQNLGIAAAKSPSCIAENLRWRFGA